MLSFLYSRDEFSNEGCKFVAYRENQVVCECEHLTSFAVLMQMQEVIIFPPLEQYI